MIIIGILFVVLIVLIFVAYGSLSWGFVVYKFWYWFLIPVFPDLPMITFAQAVGLMFFISIFKYSNHAYNSNQKIDDEDKTSKVTSDLLAPWLFLMVGYIALSLLN